MNARPENKKKTDLFFFFKNLQLLNSDEKIDGLKAP